MREGGDPRPLCAPLDPLRAAGTDLDMSHPRPWTLEECVPRAGKGLAQTTWPPIHHGHRQDTGCSAGSIFHWNSPFCCVFCESCHCHLREWLISDLQLSSPFSLSVLGTCKKKKICLYFFFNIFFFFLNKYVPSLLNLPPTSYPIPALGCHRAPGWAPCVMQQLLISYLVYTWWFVYFNATLSICPILSCPCCVHRSVLYVCVSISSHF